MVGCWCRVGRFDVPKERTKTTVTPAKAKVIFATHMQAARKRKLTAYESNQLSTARQVLRTNRKPAMNPKSAVLIYGKVQRIYATKTQPQI